MSREKKGLFRNPGSRGLGDLQIQVELRQVGGTRLPHQARELGQPFAGETHLRVQLRGDVHRLRDRERKRLLVEEIAVLIQNPVGDGAFPLLSRTLGGGRHGQQRQQRRDAAQLPPAVATRIERFHRFSFRRLPSFRRAGSGTLRGRRETSSSTDPGRPSRPGPSPSIRAKHDQVLGINDPDRSCVPPKL